MKLFYNDYGAEGMNDKSTKIFDMVKAMKAGGIPIDGVGTYMHCLPLVMIAGSSCPTPRRNYTLSPQPSALSPQPSALSPQPSALSPQPSALSQPQPQSQSQPQPQPQVKFRS